MGPTMGVSHVGLRSTGETKAPLAFPGPWAWTALPRSATQADNSNDITAAATGHLAEPLEL